MFGFFKKDTSPKDSLRKCLGKFNLPTFPAIAHEVLQKIRDPNSTPPDISKILEQDPGLSLKVLRTVNSAAFQVRKKVDSLSQAIAIMGMSALESMVLSVAVGNCIPSNLGKEFDGGRFWTASARRATAARALAGRLHPATINLSYTAGLLQDMAMPFLITQNPDYLSVLEDWDKCEIDLTELEQNKFGWTHAEVATWICAEWEVPETLAAAIGGHHGHKDDLPCPPAVILVSSIREREENPGTEKLIQTAQERHGLDPEQTRELLEAAFEEATEISQLFS